MSQYQDDARELADRINEDIEGVISKYWPSWIRGMQRGKPVAYLTPRVKEKGKKPTSSFVVHLDGADRGKWYRFSQRVGGYGLQLLFYAETTRLADGKEDWAKAYRLAREYLGIRPAQETSEEDRAERERRHAEEDVAREQRRVQQAAEAAEHREERVASAQEIWAVSKPLKGSHGDAYLQARGLPPVSEWPWDPAETIRFHPRLTYELDRSAGAFPAIVARVQDCFGETIAVWQIYLHHKLAEKAPVDNPKVGRGPAAGGAVRIGGDGPKIGGGEGLETSLAAWVLEGYRYPVWSLLSTSGVASFEPPAFVQRFNGFPDGDLGILNRDRDQIFDPPGIRAMRTLQERLVPMGIPSMISEMCIHGDALNLLLTMREHEERIDP